MFFVLISGVLSFFCLLQVEADIGKPQAGGGIRGFCFGVFDCFVFFFFDCVFLKGGLIGVFD